MPSWWVPVQWPIGATTLPGASELPAPIVKPSPNPPAFSFLPVTYTRQRATIGPQIRTGVAPPSATDLLLGQVKQALNYAVTATKLAVQAAITAGSQAATSVASALPVVGVAVGAANIGLSYGQNARTRAAKEQRDIGTATTALAAIPLVGLVTFAVSIPQMIEGLVDSANERKGLAKQRSDYVQAGISINAKVPTAVTVSDRIDEFHMLPRAVDRAKMIAWIKNVHQLALFSFAANAEDKASGYEGMFAAMGQVENGNATLGIPGRDLTRLRNVWSQTQQDAWIAFLACRDILARLKQPIPNESAADYDGAGTWIRALWGWANLSAPGVGILPGAHIPITPAEYGSIESVSVGGTQGGEEVPVVPSLAAINDQMRVPGNSLELMLRYWESADVNTFHGSSLWLRISQGAIRETIDAVAAPIAALPPAPYAGQVQAEIGVAVVQAIDARRQLLYAQHPEFFRVTSAGIETGTVTIPLVPTTGLVQTPSGFVLGAAGGSTTPFVPGSAADGQYQALIAEGAEPGFAYSIANSQAALLAAGPSP